MRVRELTASPRTWVGGVFHARHVERFAGAPVESADFVRAERVHEREHRRAVRDLTELDLRLCADALRRRIRAEELGIARLEFLQLAKKTVVFGVGDERLVERVVLVVVPLDLFAQRDGAPAGAPRAGRS